MFEKCSSFRNRIPQAISVLSVGEVISEDKRRRSRRWNFRRETRVQASIRTTDRTDERTSRIGNENEELVAINMQSAIMQRGTVVLIWSVVAIDTPVNITQEISTSIDHSVNERLSNVSQTFNNVQFFMTFDVFFLHYIRH